MFHSMQKHFTTGKSRSGIKVTTDISLKLIPAITLPHSQFKTPFPDDTCLCIHYYDYNHNLFD